MPSDRLRKCEHLCTWDIGKGRETGQDGKAEHPRHQRQYPALICQSTCGRLMTARGAALFYDPSRSGLLNVNEGQVRQL
jgi:hypothetical protein